MRFARSKDRSKEGSTASCGTLRQIRHRDAGADAAGKAVRTFDGTKGAGINRVLWNLAPNAPPNQQGGAGFGGGRGAIAPSVEPGTYIVTLAVGGKTMTKPVTVLQDRWLGER